MEGKVSLMSLDNQTFEVDFIVAMESQTIKRLIHLARDINSQPRPTIPLANVSSDILTMVIKYCEYHVQAKKSDSGVSAEDVQKWDKELVSVDKRTMLKLIKLRKHLVTASYVDKNMSDVNERAKSAGVTILGEMGLDPGIDHMMAMKMINHAHIKGGKIISFVSYCGGLPSPAAANNPLGYKFSWSPAGALKAGRNPALYSYKGQIINVNGENLYESATSLRLPHLPAFALERLPNRDSLVYGDLYGITDEALTVFRATLRYEGFSEIMSSLTKLGFFNNEFHPMLSQKKGELTSKPTFNMFLLELLKCAFQDRQTQKDLNEMQDCSTKQMDIREMLIRVGCCKGSASANKTASCIKFLGLDDDSEIPDMCKSAFDVICSRMEERLNYSPTEQDMVLLHHEVEVAYEDRRPNERHAATLLEFGKTEKEKQQTAMARTVGITAAIGAMLLLEGKIKSTGVLRPLEPEIYLPALEILAASGIHMNEEVEYVG